MFIDQIENILPFRHKEREKAGFTPPETREHSGQPDPLSLLAGQPDPLSLLGRAGLHEITPASWKELGAGLGFLTALAAQKTTQQTGPVLWVQQAGLTADEGHLFGPGFDHFGLKPDQILIARAHHTKDVLGILEESLATPELSCVIGHLRGHDALYDLTASRRLHLRAEQNALPAFIMRSGPDITPSAALCRWQVSAAPSVDLLSDKNISETKARWRIDLMKSRISPPAAWHMDWRYDPDAAQETEAHAFSVSAPSRDRQIADDRTEIAHAPAPLRA